MGNPWTAFQNGKAGAGDWPDYRGPNADGVVAAKGLPLEWSEQRNVRWKTPVSGRAWSSPVIQGEQIWLTNATPDGKTLSTLCIHRDTGRILHDRVLFEVPRPEIIHEVNSYASPSPLLEAGRVYAHFGTYGTVCVDTKTFRNIWERRDVNCAHGVGAGSSPVLFDNLLILTMDGMDVQYTIALDKRTGKTVWKTDRSVDMSGLDGDSRKAFATPVFAMVGGKPQLVSSGAHAVYGYEPHTGKELWRIRYRGFSNASRSVVSGNVAYINTGFGRADLWAIRLDGAGDVTDTHVLWKYGRTVSLKPSPILVDGLIFMVHDSGVVTCLEAKTGEEIWKERIGGSFSASPLYAEGNLYLFSENGTTTVLKAGRTFEKRAESRLDAGFMASPAVAGKALYLRTTKYLYRVEV
jgi:outer membrane protein assembly factor BamB